MKALNINYDRYLYPDYAGSLEEFIEFINNNGNTFIKMQQCSEENCVFPFFIEDEIKTVYVNCMSATEIFEEEITLLSRSEYEERLKNCIQEKCLDCMWYSEDKEDNLQGHREKLCLNGTCDCYEKDDDDDEDDDDEVENEEEYLISRGFN